MDPNQQKEQFSRAYVQATAAAAGFSIFTPNVDDDSVDMQIAACGKRSRGSPGLELQLKCTASGTSDVVRFPLKLKNYNDLRRDCVIPRILIVVVVPERPETWLSESGDRLIIYRRAYWTSLAGRPRTSNAHTVTIELPPDQPFSVDALNRLMALAAKKEQA